MARNRFYYRPLNEKGLQQKYLSKNGFINRFIDGFPHRNEAKVGYCWNSEHRGYLTTELMKRHNCKNKNCRYFQPYNDKRKKDKGDDT